MVWYRVGAADEPPGRSGIAHFLEHLMFKGTDAVPDGAFSEIVAANGGQSNAFTGQDYTAYFQRIAADRLELVMRLEADRMANLRLSETDVATERDVILEERSSRTDNSPSALFSEQLRAALFLQHPYRIPVIGWRHEIEALDRTDVLAFYERHYAPDNAILVVAGDVTPATVRRLAERHYGPLKPSGRPRDALVAEPPHRAPRRLEMADPRVATPHVTRSYVVPAYDPEAPGEAAALSVLAQILGGGATSRFSRALEVERKIAVGTGASYAGQARGVTSFGIYGTPVEGRSLADVEAALDAELARMATDGPTEEELARVKRLMRASRIFARDRQTSLARLYGAALALGLEVADVRRWPEAVDGVTAEAVRGAAEGDLLQGRTGTGGLRRAEGRK